MNRDGLLGCLGRPAPAPQGGLLPSGSPALDVLLGGGWPPGAVCELAGPPHATAALAYRAIAAVQAARPGEPVILCDGDYDPRLARRHGADPARLLFTRDPAAAMAGGPVLAVAGMLHAAGQLPARDSRGTTVLAVTARPGDIRSAACIQLVRPRGCWVTAARLWLHDEPPSVGGLIGLPACTGRDAAAQEILYLAVTTGIIGVRGNRHAYGGHPLGNGWKAAAAALAGDRELRAEILGDIARIVPVNPAWRQAYA